MICTHLQIPSSRIILHFEQIQTKYEEITEKRVHVFQCRVHYQYPPSEYQRGKVGGGVVSPNTSKSEVSVTKV